MAITIDLYTVSCDPHTVDKSGSVSATASVSGTMRGDLDVLAPTITVEGDASGYNYAYIADMGRYYHITGCNRERTGICTLSLRVDVLWTYAAQIMQLPAVASRSYRLVNAYLPDDQQRVRQYTQCVNKEIGTTALDHNSFHYSSSGHILLTVG